MPCKAEKCRLVQCLRKRPGNRSQEVQYDDENLDDFQTSTRHSKSSNQKQRQLIAGAFVHDERVDFGDNVQRHHDPTDSHYHLHSATVLRRQLRHGRIGPRKHSIQTPGMTGRSGRSLANMCPKSCLGMALLSKPEAGISNLKHSILKSSSDITRISATVRCGRVVAILTERLPV